MKILTIELDKIALPDWLSSIYTPLQLQEVAELVENEVWVTANKRQIPVREMTTGHIKNCIKCWNGEGASYIPPSYLGGKAKWIKIFEKELINRA